MHGTLAPGLGGRELGLLGHSGLALVRLKVRVQPLQANEVAQLLGRHRVARGALRHHLHDQTNGPEDGRATPSSTAMLHRLWGKLLL